MKSSKQKEKKKEKMKEDIEEKLRRGRKIRSIKREMIWWGSVKDKEKRCGQECIRKKKKKKWKETKRLNYKRTDLQ